MASKKFIQEEGKQEARVLASPDSQGKGHLYGGATITQALCFFLLINSGRRRKEQPEETGKTLREHLQAELSVYFRDTSVNRVKIFNSGITKKTQNQVNAQ